MRANTGESRDSTGLRGTRIRLVSLLFDGFGDRKVAAADVCGQSAGRRGWKCAGELVQTRVGI